MPVLPSGPAVVDAGELARQIIERLAARQALADAVAASGGGGPAAGPAATTALWSLVHGFALLLVDGRLRTVLEGVPGHDPDILLAATLACVRLQSGGDAPDGAR